MLILNRYKIYFQLNKVEVRIYNFTEKKTCGYNRLYIDSSKLEDF